MNPTLRVTTVSGAVYEFSQGMTHVRRAGHSDTEMRRDGEWVDLVSSHMATGQPMRLTLDGVAPVGPTERTTTTVVSIEGVQQE